MYQDITICKYLNIMKDCNRYDKLVEQTLTREMMKRVNHRSILLATLKNARVCFYTKSLDAHRSSMS